MEEIIHYKFVNERLSQDREVTTIGVDPADVWFIDDMPETTLQSKITTTVKNVEITQDEFKKAMSNNEHVGVFRETIVVSENSEKGTVSLKKYLFSKQFIQLPKIKKRKFKIIRKEMYSLTINKFTGDFSIYNRKRAKKKDIVFIRKNISNSNVKGRIQSLVSDGDSRNETNEAIGIFYSKLGYSSKMLNYTDLISVFFKVDPKDKDNKHSLPMFPFLNYIFENQIHIPNYYLLYPFESVFQKNKKNYKHGNLGQYFTDHYRVKNKGLVDTLLEVLVRNNQQIDYNKYNVVEPKINEKFLDNNRFDFETINPLTLKIFDYYNVKPFDVLYSPNIISSKIFTNVGAENQVHIPSYFFDMLNLYEFKLNDVLNNMDKILFIMNELYSFYQFGVKLKITTITQFNLNGDNIFDKLFDALCLARNTTGTFLVNNEFIKRVNRFIPKDVKISFPYAKRIPVRSKLFSERHGLTSKQKYDRLFDNTNHCLNLFMSIIDDKNPEKCGVYFNKNYYQASFRSNTDSTNHKYNTLINALNNNTNGILNTLEIKQVYSKQYFEDLCQEKMGINATEWVDYIK
jgi:hypothetical protein